MLRTMRHLAQSWVFKGLMMILIVSFGIWGVGDIFKGNPLARPVATVNGQTISVQELDAKFKDALAQARRQIPDLTEQQAKQMGLLSTALEDVITAKEVDMEIKRLGLAIDPKSAMQIVSSQPELRNKDGSFNKDLFQKMLEKIGLEEKTFIERARQEILQHQLFHIFLADTSVPRTILEPLLAARGQRRVYDVISIADDSVRSVGVPDEKTLHDYYEENPGFFTSPEYRVLTIARLSTDDIAKGVAISDEQIKQKYDSEAVQFAHGERRDIIQVVLQDETKAKQLADAGRSTGDLTNAAKHIGLEAVPLNGTEEATLLPELVKPVFGLKVGEVAEPVHSSLGWHVLEVKKITPAGTSSLAEVHDQLRETMRRDQIGDAIARAANRLDDDLAANRPLEDIADSLNLHLIKVGAVDRSGKTPEDKEPAEFPEKDNLLKAGFGQSSGEVSPVIEDKSGNYYVIRTDDIIPSQVKPYDRVREKIAKVWTMQQQAEKAKAAAEKMAEGLKNGKAPSSFAAQDGVEVRVSKSISLLGDIDPSIPPPVLKKIADLKKGDVITASEPGHQLVLRLADIAEMEQDRQKEAGNTLSGAILKHTSDEFTDEYLVYLRKLYPSQINRDLVESLSADGG